jgi:hypothetical protein
MTVGGVMPGTADCSKVPVRRWLMAACLAASIGCYKYAPGNLDAVPAGTKVRAVLSIAAQEDVRSRVGIDARELEGQVVENNGDRLLLSVRTAQAPEQLGAQSLYQHIDLRRDQVVRVDVRKLDLLPTAGLVGVIAGAAVIAAIEGFGDGDPDRPDPGNGGPVDSRQAVVIRLPIIRW